MTTQQIRDTEQICRDIIGKNAVVHTKVCKLDDAKKIAGLRAMFNEQYPDPVRVVSVGEPIDSLLENADSRASFLTSVEFCGGT